MTGIPNAPYLVIALVYVRSASAPFGQLTSYPRYFADHPLTSDPITKVGMPPRRPQYTQENIDQHLQQIHLLDQSSSSENLEQLGPIIKQIHVNRQQEVYLRTLQGLIESKDAEVERICGENYRDFISSVSTLFSIKSHTTVLSNKISSLDTSVSQAGHGLVEKKRALLQCKKTAANLDEAIDTLQACLRVLDVVHRVSEMVKERKYWSALRVCPCRRSHSGVLMRRVISSLSKISKACLRRHSHKLRYSNIWFPRFRRCGHKSKTR